MAHNQEVNFSNPIKAMNELWMAAKVAGATGATMFATTSAGVNIEDGRVSVAVAVTCTVFIGGILWWLASRFQKIQDTNEAFALRLESIEKELKIRNERDKKNDDKEN